jgi:adenylate kinase
MFRAAAAAQTEFGLKIKMTIDAGGFVSDEVTVPLVKERLSASDAQNGYILDGFPRTIAQADALAGFSVVDRVVNLVLSNEAVVNRLGGRRVCSRCGANYHVVTLKPEKDGVCDRCASALVVRDDDKAGTVLTRLAIYREQTEPLINYYRQRGLLVDVDAGGGIDEVVQNFKVVIV